VSTSTREAVFTALFNALQAGVTGLASYSRIFTMPNAILNGGAPTMALPALMLLEGHEETAAREVRTPPKRLWNASIIVVFQNTDQANVPGATIINPILDQIDATLPPIDKFGNFNTLGGLVEGVWIEGPTLKETGDVDAAGLGGAVVPIKIRVP
jgi:hypothetical protein